MQKPGLAGRVRVRTDLPAWCRREPGEPLETFPGERTVELVMPSDVPPIRYTRSGTFQWPTPIVLREHFIARDGRPVARLYLPDGQEPSEADMVELERVMPQWQAA